MTIDPDKLEAALDRLVNTAKLHIDRNGYWEDFVMDVQMLRAYLAQIKQGGCEKCRGCEDLTVAYMKGFEDGKDRRFYKTQPPAEKERGSDDKLST